MPRTNFDGRKKGDTCAPLAVRLDRRTAIGIIPAHWPELGPCTVWTGAKVYSADKRTAYGKLDDGTGKTIRAHKAAWVVVRGAVPDGLVVCHKCDNPLCVRIEHLCLGSQRSNLEDMRAKGRAHYQRDHERCGAAKTNGQPCQAVAGKCRWHRRAEEAA